MTPFTEKGWEAMMMSYSYKNDICPVCKRPINMYNYTIVDGIKVHLGCDKK